MTLDEMWDILIDIGVQKQTLEIVTSINGYNEETLLDILYAYTGFHNFDQLKFN